MPAIVRTPAFLQLDQDLNRNHGLEGRPSCRSQRPKPGPETKRIGVAYGG
jgi:hypothetical protein